MIQNVAEAFLHQLQWPSYKRGETRKRWAVLFHSRASILSLTELCSYLFLPGNHARTFFSCDHSLGTDMRMQCLPRVSLFVRPLTFLRSELFSALNRSVSSIADLPYSYNIRKMKWSLQHNLVLLYLELFAWKQISSTLHEFQGWKVFKIISH